ncbi:MAG TPA: hypothetical protein VEU47_11280 [Candidatus Cybelea sp.]|nr:hypothetical protein [Candidatus Cybelea sp.]
MTLPADDDRALLARLRAAVADGRARIDMDEGHLTHIHSPVLRQADDTLILYVAVIAALATWWQFGTIAGLAASAAGVAAYLALGRTRRRRRLAERVRVDALSDIALWRKLWRWGGVSLIRQHASDDAACHAPKDSWQRFAGDLDPPSDSR